MWPDFFHDQITGMGKWTVPRIYLLLLCSVAQGDNTINVLFADVTEANATDSLDRIRRAPIKIYEYKYDSVPGRRQMGILGVDVEQYFPDALDILPTHSIPNKDKSQPPIVINNFPVVDKNVIFMHGFAALKELIRKYDGILETIANIRNDTNDQRLVFEEIERRLSKEAADQLIEERKMVEEEALLVSKQAELSRLKILQDRALIDEELRQERELWKYQEELARERLVQEEEFARNSMVEALKFERETAEKKELLRRETEEKLQEMASRNQRELEAQRSSFEKEKIRAEIQAKAEQERANEDVTIRRLQMQSMLDTKAMVESVQVVSAQLSKLALELVSRPRQLAAVGGIVLAAVVFYYSAKELVSMVRELVQSYLGRPSLVRETSYVPWWHPAQLLRRLRRAPALSDSLAAITAHFSSVVLAAADMDRVVQLALATRNTRLSGAPYRHVLLHGPPGESRRRARLRCVLLLLMPSSDVSISVCRHGQDNDSAQAGRELRYGLRHHVRRRRGPSGRGRRQSTARAVPVGFEEQSGSVGVYRRGGGVLVQQGRRRRDPRRGLGRAYQTCPQRSTVPNRNAVPNIHAGFGHKPAGRFGFRSP